MRLLHRHCKSDSSWKWDGITVKARVCFLQTTVITEYLLQTTCELHGIEDACWEKYRIRSSWLEKLFKQDPWKHWQLRAIRLYFLHVAEVVYPDPVKDLSTYTTWADNLFETRETGHIKVTDGSWVCPFSWIRISCFNNISLQDITIIWK